MRLVSLYPQYTQAIGLVAWSRLRLEGRGTQARRLNSSCGLWWRAQASPGSEPN